MNITFRQLRLFLALAETGSVSAAARVMHVTQPTASMQLREVSQAVGLPLYEVISRRVHLTEAGHALARTARTIAGEWDAFEQRVSGAKGLTSGRLKVAVVSTAKYFVPRLLGSFCKLHPQIDISLEVLNRDHVINRLRSNLDDLYVMSMPPADLPLEDHILMPNPLVVIAAAGHRLAARKRVTLAQLLLINLAPRLLQSVTLISMMIALLSLLYAVYVVGVWAFKPVIAPGWLTLSGMLSATGFMLGCVSSGLCLGMQYILSRVDRSSFDDVAAEVNRVDLFGSVARDLNVEVDGTRTISSGQ